MINDDLILLRAYAATGDPQAFAELVKRYAGLVFAAAQRICRNVQDAEDVAQGAFLELARQANSITDNVAGWLHCVATRRAASLAISSWQPIVRCPVDGSALSPHTSSRACSPCWRSSAASCS